MADDADDEPVTTTIRLPASLHRRLRVVLARDGRSAQEVWVAMLERWVEKKEQELGGGRRE